MPLLDAVMDIIGLYYQQLLSPALPTVIWTFSFLPSHQTSVLPLSSILETL
jgi:hypothetical protein